MKLQPLGAGRWSMRRDCRTSGATDAIHDLRMTGRGTYYSYSFDLGPNLEIFEIADRLLKTGIATVAASPATAELHVGKKVIDAEKAHESADRLERFLNEMHSDKPRITEMFRISKGLSISIGVQIFKAFAGSIFRRPREVESAQENAISKTRELVREAETKLAETLMSYHVNGAVRVRIEQKEHYPRYFESEPYIRLEMDSVFCADRIAGESTIQISLMIHRTGICIFTFSTDAGNDMDMTDMLTISSSKSREFDRLEIPQTVMSHYAGRNQRLFNRIANFRKPHRDSSERVTLTRDDAAQFQETLTMTTVFDAYVQALKNISRKRLQSEWHCYTTLSLGAPTCSCAPKQCKDSHRDDFARLAMRAKRSAVLTETATIDLLENHLKIADKELWIAPGCAVHVAWSAKNADMTDDLHQVIPLESAMLQVRQLEQIDSITSAAVVRDKNLFRAQNTLAVGLQEYQRNLLVGPDSSAIIKSLTAKLGANDLYDRLMDRVKVLESMVSTRYSRMQSRRSIAISISGFLVVLLFLLPRITDSIDTFSKQGKWPMRVVANIDDFMGGRGSVVLWIYLSAIALFVLIFIAVSVRPRFRPVRARNFGYSTKRDIKIVLQDSDERFNERTSSP